MKYLAAFGRFWYDFIVGDSVVLAIGVPVALVVAYGAVKVEGGGLVAEILLPLIVILTLLASLPLRSHRD